MTEGMAFETALDGGGEGGSVVPDARDAQLAVARAALRRLSLIDEMAGMGQRDGDPELTARCRHAAGALATMDRLAATVPDATAALRREVLADIAQDWTINPETGRSNSSEQFRRLVGEVASMLRAEFRVLDERAVWAAAGLIMAQLAHEQGLAPRAGEAVTPDAR